MKKIFAELSIKYEKQGPFSTFKGPNKTTKQAKAKHNQNNKTPSTFRTLIDRNIHFNFKEVKIQFHGVTLQFHFRLQNIEMSFHSHNEFSWIFYMLFYIKYGFEWYQK